MRHETRGEPLKELEAALRVAPSPDFAARVRERVRQQPASRWTFGTWLPIAAGAMVTLAAVAVGVMWVVGQRGTRSIARPVNDVGGVAMAAPVTPAAVALTTAPVVSAGGQPVTPSVQAARVETPKRIVRVAVSRHEPDVLVPDDERLALDRLLFAVRDGRAVVPAPTHALEDENGNLLEPRAIEIPLLKSIEPLPGSPVDGSGSIKK